MAIQNTNDYFKSYGELEVHKIMLEDSARNKAYRDAILSNIALFSGKAVLDVGAGTGILSVYCAQAGARIVYAVEASETYKIAEELVKENNVEDVVKVIHSRMEDVTLREQVDIIVSEWMGFYLLHESMLESIIMARDIYLKPYGLMFPETATLYATPCSVPSMYDNWEDVDGVSMKHFGLKLREQASQKPMIEFVKSESLLADPEVVIWMDLREVAEEDLNPIRMRHVAVANKAGKYQGICLWFTCTFPSKFTEPGNLSTAPDEPPTHWKQTVIVLPSSIEVEEGTPMAYDLSLRKCQFQQRGYTIEVEMLDPDTVDHADYCLCHMTKCILVRAVLKKYEEDNVQMKDDK